MSAEGRDGVYFRSGIEKPIIVDRKGVVTTKQFMEIGACCEYFAEIWRWLLVAGY